MRKKICAVLLATAMLVSSVSLVAFAAGNVTAYDSSSVSHGGDSIPVASSDWAMTYSLALPTWMDISGSATSYTSVEPGDLSVSATTAGASDFSGKVDGRRIVFSTDLLLSLEHQGTLLDLTDFTGNPDAGIELKFTYSGTELKNGDVVYLYHFNDDEVLIEVQTAVMVDNTLIYFLRTLSPVVLCVDQAKPSSSSSSSDSSRASIYLPVNSDAPSLSAPGASSASSEAQAQEQTDNENPNTGDNTLWIVASGAVLLLSSMGLVVLTAKKKA